MDYVDALALLKAKAPSDESLETDATALVQALEYIPLAIIFAGAYISTRALRITVFTYLELIRQSEENQTYLLNNAEAKDLRRDPSIRHAVITIWQISFEQIRKITPAAINLLRL